MSNQNSTNNVQAESAATLTPAERQFLEAYRARDYGTIGALLGSMATLGEGETLQPVERVGYLDTLHARPANTADYETGEQLLDNLVVQVFAQLSRGYHVPHDTIYGNTDLLLDIRAGVLAGLQDACAGDVLALQKVSGRLLAGDELPAESDEWTPDERAAKIEQIGQFYDELTEDEARVFWREIERARPDLYQAMIDKYVADQQ